MGYTFMTLKKMTTSVRSNMNKAEINGALNTAQKLLWGGSETENIEAHNIIAKLIVDLEKDDVDKNDSI